MEIALQLMEGGKMPEYKTAGAACADCYANIKSSVDIQPGENVLIPLGFALDLPADYEAQIRPRSGLSNKLIHVELGTIDSDYKKEISADIYNLSKKVYTVLRHERVCQIIIKKAPQYKFKVVDQIEQNGRGGFGHTGV